MPSLPKFYHPTADQLQGAVPLNEDLWFPRQQHLLVSLANTDYGRDLLCIDKHPYPVIQIRKNVVVYDISREAGPGKKLSDFRVGAKWANVVRYRWLEVKAALDRLALQQVMAWQSLGASPRLAAARFTSTTFYPDPHTESTTVDAQVGHEASSAVWTTFSNGAGTTAGTGDSQDDLEITKAKSSTTTNQWLLIYRGIMLFNTSSIGSDSVDSGAISFYGSSKNGQLATDLDINVYQSAPASNTAVVGGDFDSLSETDFSSLITLANWSTSGYNDFALNANGLANVTTDGVSKYGTRDPTFDIADSQPTTWAGDKVSTMGAHLAEHSGTSQDPKLVIVHTTTFTPQVIMIT